MTILQRPRQSGDGHARKGWYRFGRGDEAVRHTDAWEHETFAEEQARWERSDPEYARICGQVRQAKKSGEEASQRADQAKAEWDARVATQRQANDDAQKAHHALKADQTATRRPRDGPRSPLGVLPGGALAHRQDARQPRIPTTVLGNARATTQSQPDSERWIDEGGNLDAEATAPSPPSARR